MPAESSTVPIDLPLGRLTATRPPGSAARASDGYLKQRPAVREATPGLGAVALVLVLGLIAVAWRAPWLVQAARTLDADEAVTGIMALDILDGARPLYYYGQGYLGTLEPFIAAGLFAMLGETPTVLRLAPLLLWAASLGFQYLVVRHWFGRATAVGSVFFWCVAPAAVALWTVKARGGFTAVMLFGMALTWIYQRTVAASAVSRWRWLLAGGVVLGMGWWTNAMVVYYLVPLAVLAGRRIAAVERAARADAAGTNGVPSRSGRPSGVTARQWFGGLGPFVLGLGVGLMPIVVYRLSPAALSSRQLFDPAPAAWLAGAVRLGVEVLPLLFDLGRSPLGIAAAALLLGLAAAAIRDAVNAWRGCGGRPGHETRWAQSEGRIFLALLWLTVPVVALISNQVSDIYGFRYLLPLCSAVSMSLGIVAVVAVRSRSWRRAAGVALAAIWVAHCATSVASHRDDVLPDLPVQGIARAAESAGVQAVAAPYWECYRLGFLTGRQLACVPYDGLVRDGAAQHRWRRQQAFAALLPTEQVQSLLAPRDAALQADQVDASPIGGWTLVVVAPSYPAGWEERKAIWSDRLAKIADERAGCFSGWPALR